MKAFSTSILGFIITPFVILYVGDEAYGIYKLIFDWLSNVWMFDLGVSGSFLVTSALYFKKADLNTLYGDGLKAHLKILPFLFLASTGFYFFVFSIITLDQVTFLEYSIAFWINALTFVAFPLNIFRQYYEVSERVSLINIITIKQLFLTNVFMFVFAYLGFGLIGISLAYASFVILGYLYIYYLASREQGWSIKKLLKSSGKYTKEITKTGKSYLFINISQKISFLADNTIIAYFYSPAKVIPFFISQRLASLFQSQIQSLSYTGWASLIDFYNKGDIALFRTKLSEVLKFNFLITSCVFTLVWILNEKFITLWIGDKYFIDERFNILVSCLMVVNILNFLIGHILNGTGHIKNQSKAYIFLGVLNLVGSILLTKIMGFHGPILASLITMTILSVFKLYLVVTIYETSVYELIRIFLPQSLIAMSIILISKIYFDSFYESSWWMLILYSLFCGLLFTGTSFLLTFSQNEKRLWYSRVEKIYSHFKR